MEEFSAVTSHEQMEFVTPRRSPATATWSSRSRGGGSGYDIVDASTAPRWGPTYRAGILRQWALERLRELEQEHGVRSVAFEMLGPPRNSKPLFEAHLLRQAYPNMKAVRDALDRLMRENSEEANRVVSVGIPILLGRDPARR